MIWLLVLDMTLAVVNALCRYKAHRRGKDWPAPPKHQNPAHHPLCNVNLFHRGVCDCDARNWR